jgi:hypothetical protein
MDKILSVAKINDKINKKQNRNADDVDGTTRKIKSDAISDMWGYMNPDLGFVENLEGILKNVEKLNNFSEGEKIRQLLTETKTIVEKHFLVENQLSKEILELEDERDIFIAELKEDYKNPNVRFFDAKTIVKTGKALKELEMLSNNNEEILYNYGSNILEGKKEDISKIFNKQGKFLRSCSQNPDRTFPLIENHPSVIYVNGKTLDLKKITTSDLALSHNMKNKM